MDYQQFIHKRDSVHRKAKSLNSMSDLSVHSTMRHKVVRALRLAKDNLSANCPPVFDLVRIFGLSTLPLSNHHHIPAMLFSCLLSPLTSKSTVNWLLFQYLSGSSPFASVLCLHPASIRDFLL